MIKKRYALDETAASAAAAATTERGQSRFRTGIRSV